MCVELSTSARRCLYERGVTRNYSVPTPTLQPSPPRQLYSTCQDTSDRGTESKPPLPSFAGFHAIKRPLSLKVSVSKSPTQLVWDLGTATRSLESGRGILEWDFGVRTIKVPGKWNGLSFRSCRRPFPTVAWSLRTRVTTSLFSSQPCVILRIPLSTTTEHSVSFAETP